MSYSNLRQQWLKQLDRTGLPEEQTNEFGLHSLRISAATNSSVKCEELEIQLLGRWKSGEMARHYVHMDGRADGYVIGFIYLMFNFL